MPFCNFCGAKINGTEKFCGKCGENLQDINATPPTSEDSLSSDINKISFNKDNVSSNNLNDNVKNLDDNLATTPLNTTVLQDNSSYNSDSNIDLTTSIKSVIAPNITNDIPPNKKANILLISILILLIIIVSSIFGVKTFLTNKFSAKNVISKFQEAIYSNDSEKLLDIIYSNSPNLKLDDTSAKAIIKLFSTDDNKFQTVVNSLNNDALETSKLITKGSNILLTDNELFALTITDTNFFYTNYSVLVKPITLSITTNNLESTVSINDEDYLTIPSTSYSETLPLLAPGLYDLTFTSNDVFNNEISNTITVDTSIRNYDGPIQGFSDYGNYTIYSNIPDSKIFINGKDTNITAESTEISPIPISINDSVYLSYDFNGKEYTTMTTYPTGSFNPLYLDFSYYDYLEINRFIQEEKAANEIKSLVSDYIDKYKNVDFIIPTSNSIELVFKDLNNYTVEELFLARNEMLARYGYTFESYPKLRAYFDSKSWYKPTTSFSGELINDVEKSNIDIIKITEFLKMAKENCPEIYSDYVIPNSTTKELRYSDIRNLNDWQLIVARNEIFARYGLEFSTIELLEHFKSKSWFVIDSSVDNDVALTEIERKNVETILAEEKTRRDKTLNHDLGE